MGLEIVELLMQVEDTFEISITDEEAISATTVGKLHDLVVGKLAVPEDETCLSSHTFYRLRRGIAEASKSTTRLWPKSPTEVLSVDRRRRRSWWGSLQKHLGLTLPELERPRWVEVTNLCLSLLVAVIVALLLPASKPEVIGVWFICLAVPCLYFAHAVTRPLAFEIPGSCSTLGGLGREVLTLNFGRISKEVKSWSEAEVWQTLHGLVAQKFGVSREAVRKHSSFVQDLNAG